MRISYHDYEQRILGGWIGKSIGGAVGARFEGNKNWIEVPPDQFMPDELPPNDDLDLQVLWLGVLERKGPALTGRDLASAWLDGCWYPFGEYGIFRKNWRLGIAPPMSGRFDNKFWETGMGCPIRSEIWGYVFAGAPDLAASYARIDGSLDHTDQSIGAEQMLSAMASMAFWMHDVAQLIESFLHYLPTGSEIELLVRTALECWQEKIPLSQARQRLMLRAGHPEACDARINVPFAVLALLYGQGDMEKTIQAGLNCGYDTDCTLATACALLGQIQGPQGIPSYLRKAVGDTLVMGIEYRREEMTLSALARDTARVGAMLASQCQTGLEITNNTQIEVPTTWAFPSTTLNMDYASIPAAAPGERVTVHFRIDGKIPDKASLLIACPAGWSATPEHVTAGRLRRRFEVSLYCDEDVPLLAQQNLFTAKLSGTEAELSFGIAGAALWQVVGVFWDVEAPQPYSLYPLHRIAWHVQQHWAHLDKPYLMEPPDSDAKSFATLSAQLGHPATIPAREMKFEPDLLTGLQGPCCIYLGRTIHCPEERDAYLQVGHCNDYRVWLNGQQIGEDRGPAWWTPTNGIWPIRLQKGPNNLMVKLIRQNGPLEFSLGLRHNTGKGSWNCQDWMVDLADENLSAANRREKP